MRGGGRHGGDAPGTDKPATILVVEDEALIGEMVAEALQEQGFHVFVASNAADALRYVESGASIDALFTDIHLPGGMDGSELASRVRSLRPEMPVVYASGEWHPTDREAVGAALGIPAKALRSARRRHVADADGCHRLREPRGVGSRAPFNGRLR